MPDSEKPEKPGGEPPCSRRNAETNGGPEHPPDSQLPDSNEGQPSVDQPVEQAQQAAEVVHPAHGLLEADLLVAEIQRSNGNGHGYDGSVNGLLRDQEFIESVVTGMVENGVIDDLLDDIVDKLRDALQENEQFKRQLLQAVASHGEFRAKLIGALIKSLS